MIPSDGKIDMFSVLSIGVHKDGVVGLRDAEEAKQRPNGESHCDTWTHGNMWHSIFL